MEQQPDFLQEGYKMTETETHNTTMVQAKMKADASLIKYRLETTQLIYEIQNFLLGSQRVTMQIDGRFVEKDIELAKPLLNQDGVFGVLNKIRMILNPQVVQGNFLMESWWREFVADLREDLTIMLMVNAYDWAYDNDIDHFNRNVDSVIDTIMSMIEPFMTRLLFNKERESYADTMQSSESVVQQKSGMGLFKRN